MLTPKQKGDEQDERGDGGAAARGQQPSDRDGVSAAGRIVTVAQQPDVIGQCADGAVAGVDNRKANARRLESKAGEGACDAAVGCDHKGGRRMRELVAVAVIDGFESQGLVSLVIAPASPRRK